MKKYNLGFLMFALTLLVLTSTNVLANENTRAVIVNLVNQDPDPASAGEIFDVRISIENAGGISAQDLVLELNPSYPLKLVPGQEKEIELGTIGSYQSGDDKKIVRFQLMTESDAPKGIYDLGIFYYEKGSTSKVEKKLQIEINNKNIAEISQIDTKEILPGKTQPIKFQIKNVGNSPLEDVVFMWENEDGIILPVGSDNTRYINQIRVGEIKEVEYIIMADNNAPAGLYKLNLYLNNDQNSKIVSTNAGIYVGGKTDFEVAFSSSTELDNSFSIANIGSNPAYSVSVSVPQQDNWRTNGANSAIIGNLNNGDYTIASFNLVSKLTNTTISKNPLLLRISYTDTTGQRVFVDKEVSFSAQSPEGIIPGSRQGMKGTSPT